MASLSVAQAKDQLPAMLRRVEAGEIITITRNGKPVATVTPIDEAAEKQARRKALNDRIRAFAQTLPPQSDSVAMIRGMRGHDDGLPWE
ncbi:type II toxin-antitoxin system Phd/YefM family antitoxin [Sandaracinobacteroides saxicola]|uniref:Antitoxin n=1 Tax=Sandaracinobacteroides saxicola TaxID=2759707 RepID=A0A7G5IJI9_9SPHN|nr:type II toxin-antitoxin system prevent-host-death family antitoxin [Sandaracinobacteroides saxicola]QMW23531.1 type II toxin-antitoxin system prevent-host-death family antitoxin [Sandaracinobacteroides saxicola]